MIFVNLLSRDLAAAREFYTALGFTIHESFSDEATLAVVIDDKIALLLHLRERFAELVAGDVGDPTAATTVVNSLTADSREEVDELVAAALGAGGRQWLPAREQASRYAGSFTDPDGNAWEIVWMQPVHVID